MELWCRAAVAVAAATLTAAVAALAATVAAASAVASATVAATASTAAASHTCYSVSTMLTQQQSAQYCLVTGKLQQVLALPSKNLTSYSAAGGLT